MVTKKNIQIVVGRIGWKWIERSVLQLLLLKTKRSRTSIIIINVFHIAACAPARRRVHAGYCSYNIRNTVAEY